MKPNMIRKKILTGKQKAVLSLAAALCLLVPSCRRDPSVDAALLDEADQAGNEPALPHDAEEYTGDWAPETVYSPGDLSDVEGMR